MPTIANLPPELLYCTLELGADQERGIYYYRGRCRFLLAASLVCHAWRIPAQSLLWQRVNFSSDANVLRFLTSGRYDLSTRVLEFGIDGVESSHVLAVVRTCTGVATLELCLPLSSPRDFCLPIFAGASLTMCDCSILTPSFQGSPRSPHRTPSTSPYYSKSLFISPSRFPTSLSI